MQLAGTTMPPMIIIKGETHKSLWTYNTQDGPVVSVIETGQLIKAPEKEDISTEALTVSDAIAEVFKPVHVAAASNAGNALQKKRKQPLGGARVLTSQDILDAKRKAAAEKVEREILKEERKRKKKKEE